mgnify:CR=1 FL=1
MEVTLNAMDFTSTGLQLHVVQPELRAVQPASGPRLGGTRVLVYGVSLLDGLRCVLALEFWSRSSSSHGPVPSHPPCSAVPW